MGFLNTQPSHFYCLYVRVTYSRLGVLFVSTLSVTVWSGKMFGFFFFSYFYLFFPILPYSRPPLPQIVPREKRRGAMGCKCVLTFLLLPAGVTVDASASWMLRRVHTHAHTYDIRVYVCGVDASSTFRGSYLRIPPAPTFAPRAPSCLLPSFDPTTFSHISSHPP